MHLQGWVTLASPIGIPQEMTAATSLNSVLERTSVDRTIRKRDGRVVAWDTSRVLRAVAFAFHDVRHGTEPKADIEAQYFGLDLPDYSKVITIANRVERVINARYFLSGVQPTIEQIQDVVEISIISEAEYEVARAFMVYRMRRNESRLTHYDPSVISDYVITAKYMRHLKDLKRRETLDEAVDRVLGMHLRRFSIDHWDAKINDEPEVVAATTARKLFREEVVEAFEKVRRKEVWPSSRSMQFGGRSIEMHEAKMYNCCYSPVTRIEFFREFIYLLLCGCGCGFSVQWNHVNQLPTLPLRANDSDLQVLHFDIPDTITGWADAIHQLMLSYYFGYYVEFNYSKIRPRGAKLRTSGGHAPGHLPLKNAIKKIAKILDGAAGRRLKPIEVYDVNMHLARAVLSGGVRRSATICLFSPDDDEMMTAKIPKNYNVKAGINPHRSASNNSAVLIRNEADRGTYDKLFQSMLELGEPGFFFADNVEHGTNPCVEIGLFPVIDVDGSNLDQIRESVEAFEALNGQFTLNGLPITEIEHGDRIYGWQFCNLTTINGAKIHTPQDFYESCKAASIIGSLQADYTNVPYIGPFTKFINEREALLGVSICGVMDSPKVLLNPDVLRQGAEIVRSTNVRIANIIDTKPAARTTCVKPEGTASLVLMCGSGIHPHPAHRFFRRVQANRIEPVLQHFKALNPLMVETSIYNPDVDDVICFPVEAPDGAIVNSDLTGTQFLDIVNLVQKNWVIPGTSSDDYAPGLRHNVSNTVSFASSEKQQVADWIWNHRFEVTGISLLMDAGVYPQAPREPIETDAQILRWNSLNCQPVDYTLMVEDDDGTNLKENLACAGGLCEIV